MNQRPENIICSRCGRSLSLDELDRRECDNCKAYPPDQTPIHFHPRYRKSDITLSEIEIQLFLDRVLRKGKTGNRKSPKIQTSHSSWFIRWGTRKKVYVQVVKDNNISIYGPYETLEEADADTTDLDCDERGAFKAGNIKGAVRVHPSP